jgi:hypothetical protein
VDAWRDRSGGWTPLAEELVRRAGSAVELPADLGSIEKGLRRLGARGHKGGGQYGRWLLRYFGVPEPIASWARWMGQYHRRFADLPVSLRRRQLELWDRPPLSESAHGAWIDLGMASVGRRVGDRALVDARVQRAARRVDQAGVAARLEHALLRARLSSDDADEDRTAWSLDEAESMLDDPSLGTEDAACYRARVLDARAFRALRPREDPASIARGRALYEAIPVGTDVPFGDFRRDLGLSYCAYRDADRARAVELALRAAEHAADGGFVRLRVMAFNLASRAAEGEEATRLRARADRLSRQLEDEDLLARVRRPSG